MKNYKLSFSVKTQYELDDIYLYIAKDNPERALTFKQEIEHSILNLINFSHSGKEYKKKKCRYVLHTPYIIYYRVDEKNRIIKIAHIRHGARKPFYFPKARSLTKNISQKKVVL